MNAPDRFELFVLPDGVKKLTVQKDTKIPNAASFMLRLEDHTLGNLVKSELLKQKGVLFAGYKVPHPLEHSFVLKVQTAKDQNPIEAVKAALHNLGGDIDLLQRRFEDELKKFKQHF